VRSRDLDLPVILIAGAPSVATAVEAVAQGAFRYLVKPFEPEELTSLVDTGVGFYRLAKIKRQVFEAMDVDNIPADRVGLGVSLDRAIEGLWMAYQPIVSWPNRSLFAYEALMRSTDSSLPHPGAILHAAERLKRLPELGRAVRSNVASMLSQEPSKTMFINLHPLDLMDDDLYEKSSPLTQYSKQIVFELTERAALDSVDDVRGKIKQLRDLGFRIAVDDLGAGYAGLTSFAQLEPDIVKLDMSLVRDIHLKPTRRALVLGLLSACRSLGVDVVAEGIENAEECEVLVESGVELLQGYFFGRPNRDLVAPAFG
jgi:EAL domain-containing protein (putative c-di-GMP-specific phosphodiesterase class I)